MQAALLTKPVARSEPLGAIDRLPVGWPEPALPDGATHIAVTVGLSPGAGQPAGEHGPHREILMRIDLPGDASIHGAGVDIVERQSWVDELQGGSFEHITCRVRHRSATSEIDLAWVLHTLRDRGLVTDGDLLESIEVSA